MYEKSNVMPYSNVYILNVDFSKDDAFRSKVRGKNNLVELVKLINGDASRDFYKRLLTRSQIDEWEIGTYCTAQKDKNDFVYGLVDTCKGPEIQCRCYHTDCEMFNICRPGVDKEKVGVITRTHLYKKIKNEQIREYLYDDNDFINDQSNYEQSNVQDTDNINSFTFNFEDEENFKGEKLSIDETDPDVFTQNKMYTGQKAIIQTSYQTKMLVLAAPGTGKTYCLIEKLKKMIETSDGIEATSILILCFTRAAVREIRDRLSAAAATGLYSDDLNRVTVITFDSFATRVLIDRGIDVSGKDYDERIEMAVKEIKSDEYILKEMQHFIVDEIQDLVGPRAGLVQSILEMRQKDSGFTLLGDHLQGIYDHEIKNVPGELDSKKLIEWIRYKFNDLITVSMTENRRQSNNLGVFSSWCRKTLEMEDNESNNKFFSAVKTINTCGALRNFEIPVLENQRLAVLCRNNGETLKISSYLRKKGTQHVLRRRRNYPIMPVWLADILLNENRSISIDVLSALNENECYWKGEEIERVFYSLQKFTSSDGNIPVSNLKKILADGMQLPDELQESNQNSIFVSTIHQSKGREYDCVLLLSPSISEDNEDVFQEAKVYYVAITRAKNSLFLIKNEGSSTYFTKKYSPAGRWTEMKSWVLKPAGIEIGMDNDCDEQSFVDNELLADPFENQRYIREKVRPGDPLEIMRVEGKFTYYGIFHEKKMIGRMSSAFKADIISTFKSIYGKNMEHLPRSFDDVFVDRIYSVVKKPETLRESIAEPWAHEGVWYGVQPSGMGLIRWNND